MQTRKAIVESLETRDLMAVDSMYFTVDRTLVVRSNNIATSVEVRSEGNNYRIFDHSTKRSWTYAAPSVAKVEFQGGAGNDRFVNSVKNLSVRAFGNAGNDYLEGYGGADVLVGGDGDDTLLGYGGDDQNLGGNGNDTLHGEAGNDELQGNQGLDRLFGSDGDDTLFGQEDDDYLNGGMGVDQLVGGDGSVTLRNPWGHDGKAPSDENANDGWVTLSGQQFVKAMFADNRGIESALV